MYDLKKIVKQKKLNRNCDIIEILLNCHDLTDLDYKYSDLPKRNESTKLMHFQPRNQSSSILYYKL